MKVFGVGINDISCKTNGVVDKEYRLWHDMLKRCYSEKFIKQSANYKDCFVSDDWLNYSNFKKDIVEIEGFGLDGYQLDKDILIKGNKIYSKETCCFVPKYINSLLTTAKARRGDLPIGVSLRKDRPFRKYYSYCQVGGGKRKFLGDFETPLEAFNAYKNFKEGFIKLKANEYRLSLSSNVYEALMNWSVSIDD